MNEKQPFSLTLFSAAIFILGIVALQNVMLSVVVRFNGGSFEPNAFVGVVLQFISYLIAIYVFYWYKGYCFDFKPAAWVKKEQILLLAISLAFFVCFALAPLVELLPQSEQTTAAFEELLAHPIIAIFAVVFFAPLFEELIFRGVLLKGLLAKYPPALAVAVSSLAFGAFHLNWQQLVVASFVGIFCSLVYLLTDSLFYSVVFHALYNVLITFVVTLSVNTPLVLWVRLFLVIIAAIIASLQIAILYYTKPKEQVQEND